MKTMFSKFGAVVLMLVGAIAAAQAWPMLSPNLSESQRNVERQMTEFARLASNAGYQRLLFNDRDQLYNDDEPWVVKLRLERGV
jgi:hypothetical protein